ncbi:MAG: citramalate synthase [Anaerolineae bacterium]|nr:citramalate synthase [Anaerolineae bacterium]
MKLELYDTTLRDGTQREGFSLSMNDKLKIAQRLDRFGIDYIEGGWPGSNPKDIAFFEGAKALGLKHAIVTAFGSTRRADTPVDQDAQIRTLLGAGTQAVAIFGKSWDLHVYHVLKTTLDENLHMIADSVAHCKRHGRKVIYDAEHFFDGYKADPDYALETLHTAADAGAAVLVLCDTNGGTLTGELQSIVRAVRTRFDAPLGIHCHNDSGVAVANTIIAVQEGMMHVQGTVNGYGERCGNADLCTIIPNLQCKLGYTCITPEQLESLTELSHYVSNRANLSFDAHQPYVGLSAFAHKGGMHVDAMRKHEDTFQHIDPVLIGNQKRFVVSELAGRSNILYKVEELSMDINLGKEEARDVVSQIKALESEGFQFEGADASVELLIRRGQPGYEPPFELIDFHILIREKENGMMSSEAVVKIKVGDEVMLTAAEGNGPVNALDDAVRKALLPYYPVLEAVHLTDYKVRILDGDAGTAAKTCVLIDSSNGDLIWSTVGSSPNIIEASWQALADSLEYALLKCRVPAEHAPTERVPYDLLSAAGQTQSVQR